MTTTCARKENKMAASDVDVTSSIDQNEDRIEELTDEELYNLVEETLYVILIPFLYIFLLNCAIENFIHLAMSCQLITLFIYHAGKLTVY